jgi:hypothetical protein
VAFLLGADKLRYGTLVEEIENEFLRNKGSSSTAGTYPTTVAEAYDYLCNYKKDPKNLTRLLGHNAAGDSMNTGVAFVQDGNKEDDDQEQAFITHGGGSGNSNRPKVAKVCRRCGSDGHNSIECNTGQDKVEIHRQSQLPNQQHVSQLIHAVDWDGITDTVDDDEATNWVFLTKAQPVKKPTVSFQSDGPTKCTEHDKHGVVTQTHKSTVFSQANSGIPSTWYLLDNQSTCDIISNPKLVKSKDTCS